MKKIPVFQNAPIFVIILALSTTLIVSSVAKGSEENSPLGPQSKRGLGVQRLLIVAVQFPDVRPKMPLEKIKGRAGRCRIGGDYDGSQGDCQPDQELQAPTATLHISAAGDEQEQDAKDDGDDTQCDHARVPSGAASVGR